MLLSYLPDGKVQPPPPPELIGTEFEYEVEAVLSHRFKRGNKIEYLSGGRVMGMNMIPGNQKRTVSTVLNSLLSTETVSRSRQRKSLSPNAKAKSVRDILQMSLSPYAGMPCVRLNDNANGCDLF
jgi:hypothetical protein